MGFSSHLFQANISLTNSTASQTNWLYCYCYVSQCYNPKLFIILNWNSGKSTGYKYICRSNRAALQGKTGPARHVPPGLPNAVCSCTSRLNEGEASSELEPGAHDRESRRRGALRAALGSSDRVVGADTVALLLLLLQSDWRSCALCRSTCERCTGWSVLLLLWSGYWQRYFTTWDRNRFQTKK